MEHIIELKITELEANVLLLALDKLRYGHSDADINETTDCICHSIHSLSSNINTAMQATVQKRSVVSMRGDECSSA